MIPLSVPNLSEEDFQSVQACLQSGWVSSAGPWIADFERAMARYVGVSDAVALSSGTAALHLALKVAGVRAGDYVLMPNLTFVAPANAISYLGASPFLIDVDPQYWQMDLELAKTELSNRLRRVNGEWVAKDTGRRIAAILLVHLLGYAHDVPGWVALAREYGWPLVEDAAEAVGSSYEGKALGTWGDVGCLSFNGNKIMTTGGGGMVFSPHPGWLDSIRHLSTQARVDAFTYRHDQIGYNYRMSSMAAALGLSQLNRLPSFVAHKTAIMHRYQENLPDVIFPKIHESCQPNHWLCTGLVKHRDGMARTLEKAGIQTRALWTPMNQLPMFQSVPYLSRGQVSQHLFQRALSLPSSSALSEQDQNRIMDSIRDFQRSGK
ncbi:MAG: aminotransferase class I/II-fold pyridoxal phosphate-dependent enzyme [Bacteroidota bacterium]